MSEFKAVIFDLFGTLIPNFSASAHRQSVIRMAETLQAPPEPFWELWSSLFPESILGVFPTLESKIEHLCRELGINPSPAALAEAARIRYEFESATMDPRPEAVGVLRALKNRDLKIGLITDCSAEAPAEWPRSPLSPWFDVTVFSCLVGMRKPDPRIYRLALDQLKVSPQESLYVGDGSSRELSGAAAVGLTAVMLKAPGERHPDVFRVDLEEWSGRSITALPEVLDLVG